MQIVQFGASGQVGSRVLAELLLRGHQVTAVTRHPEKIESREHLTLQKGDINDSADLEKILPGHDAVISTTRLETDDPHVLVAALKKFGIHRLLVAGNTGVLELSPGVQLVDSPYMPEEFKSQALAFRQYLQVLQNEPGLDWTFVAPTGEYEPGERTAQIRIAGQQLIGGMNKISYENFAVGLVDELEKHEHAQEIISVSQY